MDSKTRHSLEFTIILNILLLLSQVCLPKSLSFWYAREWEDVFERHKLCIVFKFHFLAWKRLAQCYWSGTRTVALHVLQKAAKISRFSKAVPWNETGKYLSKHILSGLLTAFPGSNSLSVLLSHTSSASQQAHGKFTGSLSVGAILTLSTNKPFP